MSFQFAKCVIGDKYILKFFYFFYGDQIAEVCVWIVCYDQIHLTCLQKFGTFNRCSIGHFYVGIWKSSVKAFQIGNQKVSADGVTCTDSDLSAGGGGFQNLSLAALDQVDRRFNVAKKNLAFRGELYFFVLLIKRV